LTDNDTTIETDRTDDTNDTETRYVCPECDGRHDGRVAALGCCATDPTPEALDAIETAERPARDDDSAGEPTDEPDRALAAEAAAVAGAAPIDEPDPDPEHEQPIKADGGTIEADTGDDSAVPAGETDADACRRRVADRLEAAGVDPTLFVDVVEGEKGSRDHTLHAPEDVPGGNYGVYSGTGDAHGDDTPHLVLVDVDDYGAGEVNVGLAALSALPETFTTKSPHTDGETGGHRYYAVETDATVDDFDAEDVLGRYIRDSEPTKTFEAAHDAPVALALAERYGKPNVSPSWGEVRVVNQYVVGPGSQLDGCGKDWCDACAEADGGYYTIAQDVPIATIDVDDLATVLDADGDVERVDTTPSTRSSPSSSPADDATPSGDSTRPTPSGSIDVDERLDHALDTNDKLARLWRGDTSDYGGDRSEADAGLAAHLGWWFEGDKSIVRRLMDRSGAEKWAERTDASYRESTLEAVDMVDNPYDGTPPEAGDPHPEGGTYDKMPLWGVRKLAVDLDVVPSDYFVTKEGEDGGEYLDFAGEDTRQRALDAIEEAGYSHGWDPVDDGPEYPTFDDLGVPGVELEIEPMGAEDVKVRLLQNGETVHIEKSDRDLWHKPMAVARLASRAAEHVNGDSDAVVEGVKGAFGELRLLEDDEPERFEGMLRSPAVRGLRQRTDSVEYYPDTDRERYMIDLEPPEDSPMGPATITLAPSEINDTTPRAFTDAHVTAFSSRIVLEKAEWAQVVDYWLDVQTVREGEGDPIVEALVEDFERMVTTSDVWADAEGFSWGSRNGYFEENYGEDGEAAILVPGREVVAWLKEQNATDMNLSLELRERGIMVETSTERRIGDGRGSVWPISADAVGFDTDSLRRRATDDDAPEVL
jgi:hypothetical protein